MMTKRKPYENNTITGKLNIPQLVVDSSGDYPRKIYYRTSDNKFIVYGYLLTDCFPYVAATTDNRIQVRGNTKIQTATILWLANELDKHLTSNSSQSLNSINAQ